MDLEQKAVLRLREGVTMSRQLYDGMPLMITYSGGKDSDVIAELAVRHLPHAKIVRTAVQAVMIPVRYIKRNLRKTTRGRNT